MYRFDFRKTLCFSCAVLNYYILPLSVAIPICSVSSRRTAVGDLK